MHARRGLVTRCLVACQTKARNLLSGGLPHAKPAAGNTIRWVVHAVVEVNPRKGALHPLSCQTKLRHECFTITRMIQMCRFPVDEHRGQHRVSGMRGGGASLSSARSATAEMYRSCISLQATRVVRQFCRYGQSRFVDLARLSSWGDSRHSCGYGQSLVKYGQSLRVSFADMARVKFRAKREQLKKVEGLLVNAKDIIWPCLFYMCHIRSAVAWV